MAANTLQPVLPWIASHAEDRRFRLILVQVLGVCFVIGGIIPTMQVPLPETEAAVDLPPRLVRIIEDRTVPAVPLPASAQPAANIASEAPQPEASQPLVKKPMTTPGPEVQKIPDGKPQSVKVKPVETPRQKAAQAGLLAMSDVLGELRSITPKAVTTGAGRQTAVSGLPKKREKPSMLAADITQGSAGIVEGGVATQSVLGETGLPGKGAGNVQGIRPGTIGGTGTPAAPGGTPARQAGKVRSTEEIQEILDRHKSAMYTMYNRALRRDATLQGKLVTGITIAPSGRVTRCTIIDSDLNAASLEEQLIQLIKRIDFGNRPGVPVVTTKVPIEFFPQ